MAFAIVTLGVWIYFAALEIAKSITLLAEAFRANHHQQEDKANG